MKKIVDFIGRLPTTNLRISSSIIMALGTWVKVLATGWEPTVAWLGFLVAWAGIDAAQFTAKRMTHINTDGTTLWGSNGNGHKQTPEGSVDRRQDGEEDGTEPI